MEQWKEISGNFDMIYYVSNLGNIKTTSKLLKQSNVLGYKVVGLRSGKKFTQYRVHRLVAQAFIPNPNNLPCINHKDENKENNNVDNLEWCTYYYNNHYGTRPQRIRESNSRRGCPQHVRDKIRHTVTQKQGRPVIQCDLYGNELARFVSTKDAERATGVPHNIISHICSGKRKCFKNITFKYNLS